MKKVFALILTLALIACLAACGASEETTTTTGTDADTTAASETVSEQIGSEEQSQAARLIINSEPYVVTAKDGFDNAGVTELICDATETYSFKASGDAQWKVFVLDKEFGDGARYLSQAETPALEGDGELKIEEGKYVYILCSESAFSAESASGASLAINYAGASEGEKATEKASESTVSLTGDYQDSYSQRAAASVTDNGDNVKISIHWSSSATDYTSWEMNCTRDGDKLVYSDCTKTNFSVDENNNEKTEKEYENGKGYFTVKDGSIAWNGAAEEDCVNCVFSK